VGFGKGRPRTVRARRRHDQVDVIGHQAIGTDGGTSALRCRGDQTLVKAIVVGLEKHRLAPIAALGDMVGKFGTTTRAIRAMPVLPQQMSEMVIAARVILWTVTVIPPALH
jgi:hypothetical protein